MFRNRIPALAVACALVAAGCADRQAVGPDGPAFAKAPPPIGALTPVEQLGKAIFFDQNLSINGNQSCASCHNPMWGWTGPDPAINAHGAVYEGSIAGRFGNRKPPSSAYATQSPVFHYDKGLFVGGNFWDGRATGEKLGNPAADQAQGPFLNPLEQDLAAPSDVVSRVCEASYGSLFRQVWGNAACDAANVNMAYDNIALSIAAYEASSESNAFTSRYDYYLAGMATLSKEERKGLNLFLGKGKCAKCHVLSPTSAGRDLFTDFTFDNLGVPRNPENPFYGMTDFNPQGQSWVDQGLGGFLDARLEYQAYAPGSRGKHKVPTLRNVDRRESGGIKAFGHNGYFKSLWQIVHFYNTRDVKPVCSGSPKAADAIAAGCWPAPELAANVNTAELGNLRLTTADEWAIVAFLRTLSDGYIPD